VRGLQNRGRPGRDQDFASWIAAKFGPGIARHFMLPYNRKFWRFPLSRMTCGWTRSFVPVPSRGRMLLGARGRDGEFPGYNATFWYPSAGRIDVLPRSMAENCGNILYGRRVVRIDVKRRVAPLRRGRVSLRQADFHDAMPELRRRLFRAWAEEEKACVAALKWNSLLIFKFGLSGNRLPPDIGFISGEGIRVFTASAFPPHIFLLRRPGRAGKPLRGVSYPREDPGMNTVRAGGIIGLRQAGGRFRQPRGLARRMSWR